MSLLEQLFPSYFSFDFYDLFVVVPRENAIEPYLVLFVYLIEIAVDSRNIVQFVLVSRINGAKVGNFRVDRILLSKS